MTRYLHYFYKEYFDMCGYQHAGKKTLEGKSSFGVLFTDHHVVLDRGHDSFIEDGHS